MKPEAERLERTKLAGKLTEQQEAWWRDFGVALDAARRSFDLDNAYIQNKGPRA